jgi:PEP-CTERM motif
MKKFVLALTFTVLLGNARTLADTQTFNAYGAAMLPEQGASDPTPEPASLSLLGIGVLALAGMVRRKLIP